MTSVVSIVRRNRAKMSPNGSSLKDVPTYQAASAAAGNSPTAAPAPPPSPSASSGLVSSLNVATGRPAYSSRCW